MKAGVGPRRGTAASSGLDMSKLLRQSRRKKRLRVDFERGETAWEKVRDADSLAEGIERDERKVPDAKTK